MLDPLSNDLCIDLPNANPRPDWPVRRLLKPSPDHPDDYIMELDYSSASKILNCQRQGENYLIWSREADKSQSATDFGKLFHECEELRLAHGFTPAVAQRQREMVIEWFASHPVAPTDHRTAERMLAVLQQYNERYQADDWHNKVIQHEGQPFIERPFKIELTTIPVNDNIPYNKSQLVVDSDHHGWFDVRNIHVFFTGRIDTAIEESRLIWVVDNKTSSRGGKEFIDAFRLSLQTRGYTWALQHILGRPVSGLIMNALVIKPPTLKVFNNTELDRVTYHYSQDSLEEWFDNMQHIVADFIGSLHRGFFPQTALSFISPCAKCDYSENCQLPRDQRAVDLASDIFRDVTWNPVHE